MDAQEAAEFYGHMKQCISPRAKMTIQKLLESVEETGPVKSLLKAFLVASLFFYEGHAQSHSDVGCPICAVKNAPEAH